jgi:hypothetical protein
MGVRTRGLDIKAGAAKLKADRAARAAWRLVATWPRLAPECGSLRLAQRTVRVIVFPHLTHAKGCVSVTLCSGGRLRARITSRMGLLQLRHLGASVVE